MACNSIFHIRSRLDGGHISTIGLRMLLVLLSIAVFTTTRSVRAETFADRSDAAGHAAANGLGSAGSSVDSAAGNELASWDNGFDRLDACGHSRDVAEACATCPGLLPTLGITAWQCCHDPGARRVCAEAVAVALVGHAVGSDDSVDDEDQDDNEAADIVGKRAKYFLGKRAKYFLGKRAFGARRTSAHRPAMHHELMAEDFSLYGNGRQGHSGRPLAAEKRAKYFLG